MEQFDQVLTKIEPQRGHSIIKSIIKASIFVLHNYIIFDIKKVATNIVCCNNIFSLLLTKTVIFTEVSVNQKSTNHRLSSGQNY